MYETDPQGNIVYQSNGFPKWDNFTRFIGNDDPDWIYGLENTLNQFRDDANEGKATFIGEGVVVSSGTVEYDANGNIISDPRKFSPNTTTPVNYIDYMNETSNSTETNYNY